MSTASPPSPEFWNSVKALYNQAAELPPAQRADFLAAAQAEASVLREVRSLLAFDPEQAQANADTGFLESGAALEVLDPATLRLAQRLGPWQIKRLLGSGGMGDVYEAQRADGSYEGRAAIKLLKRGLDSASVLQRFAQERQALARLNHPHIAALLDAGITPDGLPYFVMEYVDGQSIDQAAASLSLEQKLQLFLQLADAVAYAHRQLLVHRDLKPGNVMVNAQGQVKLLDFGIAKALDPWADGTALDSQTTVGIQRPFTPQYASPEQVRGEPMGTATDIYSLGVLLYQLLTGLRPLGRTATTPAEAARCVLEEAPTRPSRLDADQTLDPQWPRTRKRLRGDLDNILMKALEKPAERRYGSVDAMALDVQRFLAGQPVSAQTPTWRYVIGKFVQRHPWGVGLSTAAALLLCISTGLALYQAARADRERVVAQQHLKDIRALAKVMMFDANDALGNGIVAGRKALVKAASDYLTQRMNAANLSLEETLEIVDALRRMADIEGNSAIDNLGDSSHALGRYQQALQVLDKVPAAYRSAPDLWQKTAAVYRSLSMVQQSGGKLQDALSSADKGLQAAQQALALGSQKNQAFRLACLLHGERASALYSMDETPSLGRLEDALAAIRDELACSEKLPLQGEYAIANGLVHSSGLANLARLSVMAGKQDEGIAAARRNLEVTQDLLAINPQNVEVQRFHAIARSLLGYTLAQTGHGPEGIAILTAAADDARRLAAADQGNARARLDLLAQLLTLGEVHLGQNQAAPALALCTEGLRKVHASSPDQPHELEETLEEYGLERCTAQATLKLGRASDALQKVDLLLRKIQTQQAASKLPSDPATLKNLALALSVRASSLQQLKQDQAALSTIREAIEKMDAVVKAAEANTESRSEAARLRTQGALLGRGQPGTQAKQTCAWAQEAVAIYGALQAGARLNPEYFADAQRAQTAQAQCLKTL